MLSLEDLLQIAPGLVAHQTAVICGTVHAIYNSAYVDAECPQVFFQFDARHHSFTPTLTPCKSIKN